MEPTKPQPPEFSPEQMAWLSDCFNRLVTDTNRGKNEAAKGGHNDLARTNLSMNVGARLLMADILADEAILDPEQVPMLWV